VNPFKFNDEQQCMSFAKSQKGINYHKLILFTQVNMFKKIHKLILVSKRSLVTAISC